MNNVGKLSFFCRFSPADKEIEKRNLFNIHHNPKCPVRTRGTTMKVKNLSQGKSETVSNTNKTGAKQVEENSISALFNALFVLELNDIMSKQIIKGKI
jgi:hypothetical protein